MRWGQSMTEFNLTQPTSASFAIAIGAVIAAGPFHYPQRQESYEIQQARSTYSESIKNLRVQRQSNEGFVQELAAAYHSLAERQERLDPEFVTAIYDDLEGLYEA